MNQNFKTKLFKIAALILITATTAVYTQEDDKERYTTKTDITLKDEKGNNHFLVLAKIMTADKSYVAYNVDFWVNNQVYIEPTNVSKVLFRIGKKNLSASYYRTNMTGTYSADAEILYFYIEEAALKTLQGAANVKVRLVMKDESFTDFTVSSKENFQKTIQEVLTASNSNR
ncbi:hypothetical protein [Leptospira alstonii]|uniref:Uncharacterized protein n=2 Tax=Leptospira alstonii TaxID=28452 RepID=M6D4U5_9LEPT|nr:hypothetical protein [Leptospira alstonii]EMJ97711.1 hypothetical protein LEP1GSC194_2001 [Leptospira alstonii serovar Sichuan str. 79601]EQA79679.1 hypothetical protein LEP1GSC193_3704 [Leptospira alstonii serovar Pingchang str. 80-412]